MGWVISIEDELKTLAKEPEDEKHQEKLDAYKSKVYPTTVTTQGKRFSVGYYERSIYEKGFADGKKINLAKGIFGKERGLLN